MPEETAKSENVFRSRNFRLVFLGALVSELGALLYSFAVSFYILEISGNNAFLQGLYLALCGGVCLVLTPLGGVLGDRWNKARIMFVCDYLKGGVILLATGFMALFRAPGVQVIILFITGILGSAVSGIFSPASAALLPHIVEEDRLQQANSYFTVRSSLQAILGIVLAGILYAAVSIYVLFALVGVCYVLSGVSEMFIRYAHVVPEEKLSLRLVLGDMGDGFRYLRTQKAIMALMIAILFINFFFEPISGNFIPYFVKTDIAGAPAYLFSRLLTPELWSSVFSVLLGFSSLAGAVILSARQQAEKCGRTTALLLCAMAATIICLTLGYWLLVARGISLNGFLLLLCAGSLLTGLLVTSINIPVSTALMRVVDRDKLSKVTSIVSVLSQGLTPIAAVLAGVVLQCWGSTLLLLICAAGFTAAALFLLFNRSAKEI
ncbi:MAG: MFS transporter [Oscillospiraceae bacterium]|nr:MFS transporter [Oscillospiraceae bacterium]